MATGPSGHPGLPAHGAVKVESPIETGSAITPGREIADNSPQQIVAMMHVAKKGTENSKIVNISNSVIHFQHFAFLKRITYN